MKTVLATAIALSLSLTAFGAIEFSEDQISLAAGDNSGPSASSPANLPTTSAGPAAQSGSNGGGSSSAPGGAMGSMGANSGASVAGSGSGMGGVGINAGGGGGGGSTTVVMMDPTGAMTDADPVDGGNNAVPEPATIAVWSILLGCVFVSRRFIRR